MKKLLTVVCVFLGVWAHCQDTPPIWYNEEGREVKYPRDLYIQGFVIGEQQADESIEQTHQRVKEKAQAEAIQNIVTSIDYNAQSVTQSTQMSGTGGFQEMIEELYVSSTHIHSSIQDIPNLSIESWHNPKNNQVCAFAWVKKSELAQKLVRQIINKITRAEIAIEEAERLVKGGEKIAARNSISQCVKYLQEVEEHQKVIQSIDHSVTLKDLSIAESTALKQRASALYQQLKNGVYVYIGGEVSVFEKAYPAFIQQVKQEIAPIGCTFVINEKEADWVVRIQGITHEYNTLQSAKFQAFFVLAEVNLQIIKGAESKTVFEGVFNEKGSHTSNNHEAALDAYKKLHQIVTNKITEFINK